LFGCLTSNDYTFTPDDAGVPTFDATLFTAGPRSITAKDATTPTIMGSQTGIVISPAAPGRTACRETRIIKKLKKWETFP
jgi:hypothetical protein